MILLSKSHIREIYQSEFGVVGLEYVRKIKSSKRIRRTKAVSNGLRNQERPSMTSKIFEADHLTGRKSNIDISERPSCHVVEHCINVSSVAHKIKSWFTQALLRVPALHTLQVIVELPLHGFLLSYVDFAFFQSVGFDLIKPGLDKRWKATMSSRPQLKLKF